jgi:UDP-N-acetyl-D-glucosamine/UDP-N-acetyl-D-galactosamine dehydrogenase
MLKINDFKIMIVGLGYVGLPLAIEFSKKFEVLGYDVDTERVRDLQNGLDTNSEFNFSDDLAAKSSLTLTSHIEAVEGFSSNIFIVTVPTPVDENKVPDLRYVISATEMISRILKKGDLVIYESTVYPGVTEEVCVPILERNSSLVYNKEFFCGYSPERINPGDKSRDVSQIVKVTSGSNKETALFVDQLYQEIILAGTFSAESIKVAEASKVIENIQRDVNIALINELAVIFGHMGIPINSVIQAASTKWNFIKMAPGLVGGHCIGIDPYYLSHKSQLLGHIPDLILTSRKINEGMPSYFSEKLIRKMILSDMKIKNSQILIMGLSFKENCNDLRNSKVFCVIDALLEYEVDIDVYDPLIRIDKLPKLEKVNFVSDLTAEKYDAVAVLVPHNEIIELGAQKIRQLCKSKSIIFDPKAVFPRDLTDLTL